MMYVISSYFVCRMENRNVRDQEEEMKKEDLVVVDECEEDDATLASAGIGLITFLL